MFDKNPESGPVRRGRKLKKRDRILKKFKDKKKSCSRLWLLVMNLIVFLFTYLKVPTLWVDTNSKVGFWSILFYSLDTDHLDTDVALQLEISKQIIYLQLFWLLESDNKTINNFCNLTYPNPWFKLSKESNVLSLHVFLVHNFRRSSRKAWLLIMIFAIHYPLLLASFVRREEKIITKVVVKSHARSLLS